MKAWCRVRLLNEKKYIKKVHSNFLTPNKNLIIGAFYYCTLTKCGCELLEIENNTDEDEDDYEKLPNNLDEEMRYNGVSWKDFI